MLKKMQFTPWNKCWNKWNIAWNICTLTCASTQTSVFKWKRSFTLFLDI